MSRQNRTLVVTVLASLAIAPFALAHHGWSGYETQKAFTLTGTIVKTSYGNPHTQIDVKSEAGKTWHLVLAPPSRMTSRGVSQEMLAVGKIATAHGYPHSTETDQARIEYLVLDGKRFELR